MRVLLVGSGGREHSLAWKLKQSPRVKFICHLPQGSNQHQAIASLVDKQLPTNLADKNLIETCKELQVDYALIGPEAPLVDGLGDRLRAAKIKVFGPGSKGAKLEGSKAWLKEFCQRHQVPAAKSQTVSDVSSATEIIHRHFAQQPSPLVIKADGLAQGKGVIIAHDQAEADAAIQTLLVERKFGNAGDHVLIEEFLQGKEVSLFALCNGRKCYPFGAARDHKTALSGNRGPNTGGMGCVSPIPDLAANILEQCHESILSPLMKGLKKEAIDYRGVLFLGLMMTADGPRLLEVNCRLGDPECQTLMPLLQSDFGELLALVAEGKDLPEIKWHSGYCVSVVLARTGYPNRVTQAAIPQLENVMQKWQTPNRRVFIAAAQYKDDEWVSQGGRVLNFVARDKSLEEARAQAYSGVQQLDWRAGFFREDIGN